mmetsp:Transcript_22026/g.53929  ORF Transcript_22026/g.53929 Transcript_22026/m.53929 type:complete len:216 (-) Transcript_22026:341-988(-)
MRAFLRSRTFRPRQLAFSAPTARNLALTAPPVPLPEPFHPRASSSEALASPRLRRGHGVQRPLPRFASTATAASAPESVAKESAAAYSEPVEFEHLNPRAIKEDLRFAIFEHGSKQFKVIEDDQVMLDHMQGVDVGEEVTFDNVMLMGSANNTVIGQPSIPDAFVRAVVEEQTQTRKIRVFKKRRRKASSKRTHGHRSQVTIIRVTEVNTGKYVL